MDARLEKTSDDDKAVIEVFKWVIAGNAEHDIRESLADKFPTADPARVLTAVMVRIRDAADVEPAVVFGWCIESTRDLYRRMVEIGDFAGALRAVKQMHELVKNHVPDERPAAAEPQTAEQTQPQVRSKKGQRSGPKRRPIP